MNAKNARQAQVRISAWRRMQRRLCVALQTAVYRLYVLYVCLRDPDTPRWAKGLIFGSLAYLLLPLDGIPDFLPGVGFADDVGILIVALLTLAARIKPQHRRHAARILGWEPTRPAAPPNGERPSAADASSPADVLGVAPNAKPAEIRAAYRAQAMKYHPDRVQHLGVEFQAMADEKLKAINTAYEYFKRRYPELA